MEILKQSARALNRAILILKKEGVVVCPTDTVYGFLANATSKKAVEKIYKIKKRPKSKPLPVFVKDLKMAKEIAEINKRQEKVLKRRWPGKYTFVLKRKPSVKLFGVDKNKIAVRIPKHKFLNYLLKEINRPLSQTSVNISGGKSLAKISDIIEVFKNEKKIALLIGGGKQKKTNPSKIIDLSNKKIKVLRK